MGGPRVYPMADLVRGYLRASGKRRPILSVPIPGRAASALREGANLTPDHAVGTRTWEDFLAAQLGPARRRPTRADIAHRAPDDVASHPVRHVPSRGCAE
jgi:uncharacterized protein YbjT (DUF2867 family)